MNRLSIIMLCACLSYLMAQPEFVSAKIVKMEAFDFDFTDDYRIFIYVDSSFNDPDYDIYEKIDWFEYDEKSKQWKVYHNGIAMVNIGEFAFVDFIDDIEISRQDSSNILIVRLSQYGPEGMAKYLYRNDELLTPIGVFGGSGDRENIVKFNPLNESIIYFLSYGVSPYAGLFFSIDYGESWNYISDSLLNTYWWFTWNANIKHSLFNNSIIVNCFMQEELTPYNEYSFIFISEYGDFWYGGIKDLFSVYNFEIMGIDSVIFFMNNGRYISSEGGVNPVFYDSLIANASYYDITDNQLYFNREKTLFISDDKGLSYNIIIDSLDSKIIDIYSVRNSDSVYVCTEKAVYIYRDTTLDTIFSLFDDSLNVISEINLPENIILGQNYPNPFNPKTIISYNLNNSNFVELIVFDLLGRKVKTLVNKTQTAGIYIAKWDGTDFNGVDVPSGIYFYRLTKDYFTETKKMILLR